MARPDRLCTCPPRERVPYKDTNTCFRCGGEMVPAMLPVADDPSLATVTELRPLTRAEVSSADRDALAVLTAAIDGDTPSATAIIEESETPAALAILIAAYGAVGWQICKSHGLDVAGALQELALKKLAEG